MKYGFPTGFQGPIPTPSFGNHSSAVNHPREVKAYIATELSEGAMLAPFLTPPPVTPGGPPGGPWSGPVGVPHLRILRHAQAVKPGTPICCPVRPLLAHLQEGHLLRSSRSSHPGLVDQDSSVGGVGSSTPILEVPEHPADPVMAYCLLLAASPTTSPDQPLLTYLHRGVAPRLWSPSCPEPWPASSRTTDMTPASSPCTACEERVPWQLIGRAWTRSTSNIRDCGPATLSGSTLLHCVPPLHPSLSD